jgi:hypothetical protein
MMSLHFYRDSFGGPNYEPCDDSYLALGSLLTSDIQNVDKWALDLLDALVRVQSGTSAAEEWEGNGWAGVIRPSGLHLDDLHSDEWHGDYTLDLARDVTVAYLRFLVPDAADRARSLAEWETWKGRSHPARDDI